jgi:hypothetical protein
MKDKTRFVLTENGVGKWEEYDDTYDITIHCRSREEREHVMEIIREAAKLLKEKSEER